MSKKTAIILVVLAVVGSVLAVYLFINKPTAQVEENQQIPSVISESEEEGGPAEFGTVPEEQIPADIVEGEEEQPSVAPAIPVPQPSSVPARQNETKIININSFAFVPNSIEIKVGDGIIWINNDSAPHNIGIASINFTSPTFLKGESYTRTFNEKGIFDYICAIHPNMKGKIIVTE